MRSLKFLIGLAGCILVSSQQTQAPPPATDFVMNVISANNTCSPVGFSNWQPLGACDPTRGQAVFCNTSSPLFTFVVSVEYADLACATQIVRYSSLLSGFCLAAPPTGAPFPLYFQRTCVSSGSIQVPPLPAAVPGLGDWATTASYVLGCPATAPGATLVAQTYMPAGACVQGNKLFCQSTTYTFVTYADNACSPAQATSYESSTHANLCIQKIDGTFETRQCNGANAIANTPPQNAIATAPKVTVTLYSDPACTLQMGSRDILANVFLSPSDCSEFSCIDGTTAQMGKWGSVAGVCSKTTQLEQYLIISSFCTPFESGYMMLMQCTGSPTPSYQGGGGTTTPTTTTSFPPLSTAGTPSTDYVYFEYGSDSLCSSVLGTSWIPVGFCQGNSKTFCDATGTKVIVQGYGASATCNGTMTGLSAFSTGICFPLSMGQFVRLTCRSSGIPPPPQLPATVPGQGDWAKETVYSFGCPPMPGAAAYSEGFITPGICTASQKLFCGGFTGSGFALVTYSDTGCFPSFETSIETVANVSGLCVARPDGGFSMYSCSTTNPAVPPQLSFPTSVALTLYADPACRMPYGTRTVVPNTFLRDGCYMYSCLDTLRAQIGQFQRLGGGCTMASALQSYTTVSLTSCTPLGNSYVRLMSCTGPATPPYQQTTQSPGLTTSTSFATTTTTNFPPFTTTTSSPPTTDYVFLKQTFDAQCVNQSSGFYINLGQCLSTGKYFCDTVNNKVMFVAYPSTTSNCSGTPISLVTYSPVCLPTGSGGTMYTCVSSGAIPPPPLPPTVPGQGDWIKMSAYTSGCPPAASSLLVAEQISTPGVCRNGQITLCTNTGFYAVSYSDSVTCAPQTITSVETVPSFGTLCLSTGQVFVTIACSTTTPTTTPPVFAPASSVTLALFSDSSCTTSYGTKVVVANMFIDGSNCAEYSCIDANTAQYGTFALAGPNLCSASFGARSSTTITASTCTMINGGYVRLSGTCSGPPTPPYQQATTPPPFQSSTTTFPPFTTLPGFTSPPFTTTTTFPPFTTPSGFTFPPLPTTTLPGFTTTTFPPFTTPSGFTFPPLPTTTLPGFTTPSGFATTTTQFGFTTPSGFTLPPLTTPSGLTIPPFTTPSGFTLPPFTTSTQNPLFTTPSGLTLPPFSSSTTGTSAPVTTTTQSCATVVGTVCATTTTANTVTVNVQITLNFPQGGLANYCATLGANTCTSALYAYFGTFFGATSTTTCFTLACTQARRRRLVGPRRMQAVSAVTIDVAVGGTTAAAADAVLNTVVSGLNLNTLMQNIQSSTSVSIPQVQSQTVQLVPAAGAGTLNLTKYDAAITQVQNTPIATFAPAPATTGATGVPIIPDPARCGCPATLTGSATCANYYCRVKTTPNQWGYSKFYDAQCTTVSGSSSACSCPTSITPSTGGATVTVSETECVCCQITNRRQCQRTAVNTPRPDCCYWRGGKCRDPPRLWRLNGRPTTCPLPVVTTTTTTAPVVFSLVLSATIQCTVQSNNTTNATLCDNNFAYGFAAQGGWTGRTTGQFDAALGDDTLEGCVANGNSITLNGFLWFPQLTETQLQSLRNQIDGLKTVYQDFQNYYSTLGLALTCRVTNSQCYSWTSSTGTRGSVNGGACAVIGVINSGASRVVQSISVFVVMAIAALFGFAL